MDPLARAGFHCTRSSSVRRNSILRIGLSGTNWTRKTTTIQEVARVLSPTPVEIVSLSSFVRQCPFPMGPSQTLEGSKWMIDRISAVLSRPVLGGTVQIFDRTPLDILAFTLYAAERSNVSASLDSKADLADLIDTIRSLGKHFKLIYLCRPSREWPTPETPSASDLTFAMTIDHYLSVATANWGGELRDLPWRHESRLHQIMEVTCPHRTSP